MKEHFKHILDDAISNTHISEKHNDWFGKVEDFLAYNEALDFLSENGILKKIGGFKYQITPLGRKVHRGIGIEKHLEKTIKKQQRLEQKERFDFFISKFKFFTWWIPLLISIISLSISIFNPFKNINKNQKLEQSITKDEIIQIIDSISTYNPPKKVDSLRNSKIPKN